MVKNDHLSLRLIHNTKVILFSRIHAQTSISLLGSAKSNRIAANLLRRANYPKQSKFRNSAVKKKISDELTD
jgi:hypothetical protein